MQHFVVPPDAIRDGAVAFAADQTRQITRVLRLRDGDEVVALDGIGAQYRVRLAIAGARVAGTISGPSDACHEPARRVALIVAPPRGERWEWLLQKGTEIGVARFAPVTTRYSQPGTAAVKPRHHAIVREATEQCRRLLVPAIKPPRPLHDALLDAVADEGAATILVWEGARETERGLVDVLCAAGEGAARRVNLVIGPEGGFHPDEVDEARQLGLPFACLGPLILRTETAGLVAAALAICGG